MKLGNNAYNTLLHYNTMFSKHNLYIVLVTDLSVQFTLSNHYSSDFITSHKITFINVHRLDNNALIGSYINVRQFIRVFSIFKKFCL